MTRYAMTKLDAGDYVVPSDDARTLWRVTRYEDGRVHGLDRGPELVELWQVSSTPFPSSSAQSVAAIRELEWRLVSTDHKTRKAALESIPSD